MKPKVIIEQNIPFIAGLLDKVCDVVYLSSDKITSEAMRDADALVTRTRTRCDAALLDGSRCRFIATATIGIDHIDLDYCHARGITVANAPGCNAPGVAQYVLASVLRWLQSRYPGRPLTDFTIGIVGVGHVGSIVERWSRELGLKVLLCDPPRADREGGDGFVSLARIARDSDIVTFHTPFATTGPYPTFHLCGKAMLDSCTGRPLIINSARGPIVDTPALLSALEVGTVSDVVMDCWENEPRISSELLQRAFIATPHIAGYSREGKIRATAMSVHSLCRYFDLPEPRMPEQVPPTAAAHVTPESILCSYDPLRDTATLKTSPSDFESLRNHYAYRPEVH